MKDSPKNEHSTHTSYKGGKEDSLLYYRKSPVIKIL